MSSCNTNKFLGLNSIDVLLEAFDKRIEEQYIDSRVCTLQLYNYFPAGATITLPNPNIFYDFDSNVIRFPNNYDGGWNTLTEIVKNLSEDALSKGSIYTSVRVQTGIDAADDNTITEWSKPVKISGVNGRSGAEFRFSNNEICAHADRSKVFTAPTAENPTVYFWTTDENGIWAADDVPGNVWMKYTADGKDGKDGVDGCGLRYQYCVTKENKLEQIGNKDWQDYIPELNNSNPYLWVRTQLVQGDNQPTGAWSTAKLFSTLGRDGNAPDYSVIIYSKGLNSDDPEATPGIIKPELPTLEGNESKDLTKFFEDNANWLMVPNEEETIWWQCSIRVNGQEQKILNGTEEDPFVITRYNILLREATPGQFTKYLYKWSSSQLAPEFNNTQFEENSWIFKGWSESPEKPNAWTDTPEESLWMIIATAYGIDVNGNPNITGDWTAPIKITGPRGPLSYDYRLEMRYVEGTGSSYKSNGVWKDDPADVRTDDKYPYIWAKPYLVYYKMQYSPVADPDGTYPIVQVNENPDKVVREFTPYRASGLNGDNGNTKNNLNYNSDGNSITINNFKTNNYYISNNTTDIVYNINYNQIDFEAGYTGKFVNVGTGLVTIYTTNSYPFVGSGKTKDDKIISIELNPQETIELICNDNKEIVVVGKSL